MLSYLTEAEDRLREELVETWRRSLTQYAKLHSQEVSEATGGVRLVDTINTIRSGSGEDNVLRIQVTRGFMILP